MIETFYVFELLGLSNHKVVDKMSDTLRITDFRMAGFLVARGIPFLKVEKMGKQVVFLFNNENDKATNTLNEYPNSAEQKYDSACKTMHDLVKVTLSNKG